MSLPLLISREARSDIVEAIEWLGEQSSELPSRFRQSLEQTYVSILEYPEMYPTIHREFRRALLRHFPYAIFYVVEADAIVIVGVVHQVRHPSTWQRRG